MVDLPEGLHGVYLRADLLSALGQTAVDTAVRTRKLTPFCRGVLVESKRIADFHTRAAAAILYAGPTAALTSHSVLILRGCTAADSAPIHILVPYTRRLRRRAGVIVHHGSMDDGDIEKVDGLRCMHLDFALAEVLSRSSRRTGLACADQALALHDGAERNEFRAWVAYRIASRPDPRGRRQAQELLDLATGDAESPAESWTVLVLVEGGFPPPVAQYAITDSQGRQVYRLDLAWPDLLIAVEYDGYVWHKGREAYDAARAEDLRRRGWIVIRAAANDLRDPTWLLAELAAAFRARGLAA